MTRLVEKAEAGEMSWKSCLETIISMDPANLDQETHGRYGVTIEDKEASLLIVVSEDGVLISEAAAEEIGDTSVSVNISSSDLGGILKVSDSLKLKRILSQFLFCKYI